MKKSPQWMSTILYMAGIYNIIWGSIVVLFPVPLFLVAGMEPPIYPEIFQGVGMMIAVIGAAYIAAAPDPVRYWPIIFAGLLGRILGPIGFIYGILNDSFTWTAGATIITNDLIWLIPFSIILWKCWEYEKEQQYPFTKRVT